MNLRIYVYSLIAIVITAIIAISVVFSTVAERKRSCPGHNSSRGVSLRIVGGEYAKPGEYPFHASLRRRIERTHFCGGSLISRRHVLTAASCDYVKPFDIIVAVGTISVPGGDLYEVDKFIKHPNYVYDYRRADIAVIRLEERVRLSENVTIIHLPHPEPDYLGKYEQTLYLSGFGHLKHGGSLSPHLKKLTLFVCRCPYALYFKGRICTSNIKDQTGTCYHDRGSPAVIYADLTIVMGIASQKSVTDDTCAAGRPDVFTNVQYYGDWVRLQLQ